MENKQTEELLALLEEQEQVLQYDDFSNYDALVLGYQLALAVKDSEIPVAIRVFLEDRIIFQYTMKGKEESHYEWTQKKYNVIKAIGHSSMYGWALVKFKNELSDLFAQKEIYGFGCGGFPISVKGQGIVGGVCMSGIPNPEDHLIIVSVLERLLGKEAPKLPTVIEDRA